MKKSESKTAEKKAPQNYEDFSKVVPLCGKETKLATYAVWQNSLKDSGMTLERYTEILKAADIDGNESLKQDELGAALRNAVVQREMTQEQAAAVWDAQGWKHDYLWWLSKNA